MDLKSSNGTSSSFTINRRHFLGMLSACAVPSALHALAGAEDCVILAANGGKTPGLHAATWNKATGELGPIQLVAPMHSPSFLAVTGATGLQHLYAVNEASNANAHVDAFAVENRGAVLKPLNQQPTEGNGPTHVSVSPLGRVLAVANYGGGSISTFGLAADGSITDEVSHIQFSGHGPNTESQKTPHPHSVRFSADGRFLLVNDLGLDRISVYRVNPKTGAITPNDPPYWQATAGSGPRHIAFHPNGRWVYSVNELDANVDILQWDRKNGVLTSHSRLSSAPEGSAPGAVLPGEIQLSQDGNHLYVGNRVGSETIAVFSVQDGGAALKLEQLASNGGKNTRHLTLDPSGRWMILSDVGSGEVVILERDKASGKLSPPRHRYPLDQVMCAAFV